MLIVQTAKAVGQIRPPGGNPPDGFQSNAGLDEYAVQKLALRKPLKSTGFELVSIM